MKAKGMIIPSRVSHAPLAVMPSEPRGIKMPLKASNTNAPLKMSENHVQ